MIEDEFRKHADRCLTEAQRASKKAERAFWLLLAENWQKLAKESEVHEKDQASDLLPAPGMSSLPSAPDQPESERSDHAEKLEPRQRKADCKSDSGL